MDHEHSPAAIRARLAAGPRHNYLRDLGADGFSMAASNLLATKSEQELRRTRELIRQMGCGVAFEKPTGTAGTIPL